MSKIKLVIFDLDGTLVNSQYDLTDSVNFVRHKYGFNPLPVAKVASYLGSGITALVKAVLSELKTDEFDIAVKNSFSASSIFPFRHWKYPVYMCAFGFPGSSDNAVRHCSKAPDTDICPLIRSRLAKR